MFIIIETTVPPTTDEDREPHIDVKAYNDTNIDTTIRRLAGEIRHWYRNHTHQKAKTDDFLKDYTSIELEDGILSLQLPTKTYSNNVSASASFEPKDTAQEAVYWELRPLPVYE